MPGPVLSCGAFCCKGRRQKRVAQASSDGSVTDTLDWTGWVRGNSPSHASGHCVMFVLHLFALLFPVGRQPATQEVEIGNALFFFFLIWDPKWEQELPFQCVQAFVFFFSPSFSSCEKQKWLGRQKKGSREHSAVAQTVYNLLYDKTRPLRQDTAAAVLTFYILGKGAHVICVTSVFSSMKLDSKCNFLPIQATL